MSATLEQRRLNDLDWIVVSGDRTSVFTELGRHCADRIARLVGASDMLAGLRRRAEDSPYFDSISERSRIDCPQQWSELTALAAGAGVDLEDLVLLNLRGDLGTDGTGCTDVAFRSGGDVVIGHNEDGAIDFDCVMLTLLIDGDPAVSVFWYPGMLPANSFVITANGLAWGCDAVQVVHPAEAPGRHFVARAMQTAGSIDELEAHLREHPSAGGFAYAIGDWRHNAAAHVEAAAGHVSRVDLTDELLWHTNHLRQLDGLDTAEDGSLRRGEVAEEWRPDGEALDWCLDSLARRGVDDGGVHRPGGGSVTLGTLVVECAAGRITVVPRGAEPVTRDIASLLR